PMTGATTPITNGIGGTDFIFNGSSPVTGGSSAAASSLVTSMSLDAADQKLYFVATNYAYNVAPFALSNAVYVENLATGGVTQLTSNGAGAGQFPTSLSNGIIGGVAVDAADNKVFFLTGHSAEGGSPELWYVSTNGGADQTATQVTLPGVSLNGEWQYTGLSYDSVNHQLYISEQNLAINGGSGFNGPGAIVVAQLGAGGTTVSSIVETIPESTLQSGAQLAYVPLGIDFVSLPVPDFTAAGTPAVENGAAVDLLTSTSTSTDASNGDYVGATIQITGGTFSSNENSSSDDHLSANTSGAAITASYNAGTETLTLTGYDTVADYNKVLDSIQYNVTGQNSTNYGQDDSRTLTWTINDGEQNIPAGSQNSTTTTVDITPVHTAPTIGGDGNVTTYYFSNPPTPIDSALTISDPDSLDITGATVTISSGYLAGDALSFSPQNGITATVSGDQLTLTGNASVADYQTALDSVGYSSTAADPTAADPTAGGTDVSRTIQWQVNDGFSSSNLSNIATSTIDDTACYLEGTRILTENGEVAVEDLRIGDPVVTASGAPRPIVWIGTRAYSARFAGNNPDLLPIRFRAASLAEGVPARDLLVSPKHAMFLDGVLIPAEHLVNGATIVQEKPEDDFHYFHIELESHDVLIAEGALSESFVDDDSRSMFQNAHEYKKLYPEARRKEPVYCAPRVGDGFALDRVRRRLAQRAGLPCPAATDFGALLGEVETCDHEGVSGWAQNAAFPDAPVCLDVMVDAAFFCYAYADGEQKGEGRRFAARFASPLGPSRPHEIELRRSADGAVLATRFFLAAGAPKHAAAWKASNHRSVL
uniref:Hint domain-containing protein n=1 Tax=Rhodoblastus sp. TaxID=1962975 RepID=UPI003F9C21F4